jgi:hypothetical protein
MAEVARHTVHNLMSISRQYPNRVGGKLEGGDIATNRTLDL